MRRLFPALLAALMISPHAAPCAQPPTGSVTGNITDSSGAPVARARVMVLNLDSGVIQFERTDLRGLYRVNALTPGKYKVRISAESFASAVHQPVQIDAGAVRRIDEQLRAVAPGQDGDTILASGGSAHPVPGDLPHSPVIKSISIATKPRMPFESNGDLWFTTWADDDDLYGTWGDGRGATADLGRDLRTDCGVLKLTGNPPDLKAETLRREAPDATSPAVDDKPSSVLFVGGRLYGQFHSPLGDARLGYLAYSDDHGRHWRRVGFFPPEGPKPENASPWTKDRNSPFRCMFLINMGKNYSLNHDGLIYALAIGREWNWAGGVYLARVGKQRILDYRAWEYFAGVSGDKPRWSAAQTDAVPLPGLYAADQGSAIYHPGLKRYLFMTSRQLFDAPAPWGPWTLAGDFPSEPAEWQRGYQPGIISKGLGPNSFWFTIAGQNHLPYITYSFHIGQVVMHTANSH